MKLPSPKIARLISCFAFCVSACAGAHAAAPVNGAFDVTAVAASNVKLPPFPYVDYPASLPKDMRGNGLEPIYNRTLVIAGGSLRTVEGTTSKRLFLNNPAGLSAFAAQRNYAIAIKALGGVKVNTESAADPKWLDKQAGDRYEFFVKLGFGGSNLHALMSYDVYLIRHGDSNAWIIVSELPENEGTWLTVIEEKPLAQTVHPLMATSGKLKIPVFPYIDYPTTLPLDMRNAMAPIYDQAFIIDGANLRAVEGNISKRLISNYGARMAGFALRRNYAEAIKAMGGAKVNTVTPADNQWLAKQGADHGALFEKLGFTGVNLQGMDSYDLYLLHQGANNIWIVVAELLDNGGTWLTVVEEKALAQTVGAVTADTLAASLKSQGHVALYLSFDTGLATIRSESSPVMEQVVKLLRAQPNLRLSVEGHTDNVGNKVQNQALSLARAKSVMAAIGAQQIAAARLSAVGFGADKPIADNGSEQGRAKNRRVELVRVGQQDGSK